MTADQVRLRCGQPDAILEQVAEPYLLYLPSSPPTRKLTYYYIKYDKELVFDDGKVSAEKDIDPDFMDMLLRPLMRDGHASVGQIVKYLELSRLKSAGHTGDTVKRSREQL